MLRWPLFPAALAAAFIVRRYLASGEDLPAAYRALVVLVVLAIVFQLVLGLATRSQHRGAFIGGVALTAILDPLVAPVLLAPVAIPMFGDILRRRRSSGIDWVRTTAVLNVVAAAVLGLNLAAVAMRLAEDLPTGPTTPIGSISASAPDIYVILLDEYPRADTLASTFAYDNSPFLEEMRELGFEVADDSHSNYNATTLSLVSMFAATQVPELLGVDETRVVDSWDLQRLLNRGRALEWLHQAGYSITSITSGVSRADLLAVDEVIDTGQVTTFETSVLRAGVLPRLLSTVQAEWLHAQQRDRIMSAFASLREIAASNRTRPRFVFAHVMSPHAPIVFDARGGPVGPHPCLPVSCNLWDGRRAPSDLQPTVEQLVYTNNLVVDTVRAIQADSDVPPVIVVLSDHGSRHDDVNDPDEMLRNLFLGVTPEHPGLFPGDVTPINLIPRLLNAYVDAGLPMATEESYLVQLNVVLERGYRSLVPWPQT
ncbi:MAG: hypothetical protein FIA92_04520 [Chloroflexi bacterium]|nr:hypothetical protein [Chloroflexota bacterium]